MKVSGNKGEWSELYAFLKLLSTGKLYAADEKLNRLTDTYFPVMKIVREEAQDKKIEYVIRSESHEVEIFWRAEPIKRYTQEELSKYCSYIYSGIVDGGNRAFCIDEASEIMENLLCDKIAAPSTDKTDIKMQLHDIHTGYDSVCGFSIKSNLGSSPTLLNASGATNFVFEVTGLSDDQMEKINNINSDTKIIDRIEAIHEFGKMKFKQAKNQKFAGNLMLIDSYMEEIIAEMLLQYYSGRASDCKSLVRKLEEENPLGYPRKGFYEFKFKKFLCAIALGMVPSKDWDGHDQANGGYVIVKEDGDVLAYHIYNRDAFETYLLNNTKLERGSTTRHGFASLYKEDGKMYINLNLQVRFV